MKTLTRIFFLSLVLAGVSCNKDIPDCPGKMCVIAGSWKLLEVYADEVRQDIDLSEYSLVLDYPVPATAETSVYTRTQVSGTIDSGIWWVENNGTILRLVNGDDTQLTEDWIIESHSPRQLILVMNRDISFKEGPTKIRFILEPF